MKVLFCELTPRCLGFSLLFYLWALSMINGLSTPACPDLLREGMDEDCCASVICPEGFYNTDVNCHLNETALVPVSLNNATNSSSDNNGVTCNRCHEDCPDYATCTGPNPEDCNPCFGDACNTTTAGLPIGIIAGCVSGGVVLIIVIVVVVFVVCRKCRNKDEKSPDVPNSESDQVHELGPMEHIEADDDDEVNANKAGIRGKTPLTEQISRGHDKVMRYTPDPTQICPEKIPVSDNRVSDLYQNQRHGNLIQQISSGEGTGNKKPGKTGKKGKKAPVNTGPIYENFTKMASETQEIASLPVAPVPPKGPAYQGTESPDEVPESGETVPHHAFPSLYSKQMLIKGPQYIGDETEPSMSSPSPALPKAVANKNQPKLIPTKSGLMKGPAYSGESQSQDLGGAAYNDEDTNSDTQPARSDDEDEVPGLKRGPMYQKGEPHYKNQHFEKKRDGAASVTAGLMKGPAYKAGENVEKPINRRATKPKSGHVQKLIAGFGASKSPSAENSDSDAEDYEPVIPPADGQPKYINLGNQG